MDTNHQGHQGVSAASGALATAADHVSRARQDVTALSNQLSIQIDGMRSGWGGAGADAFHRLHLAWQERRRRIVGALDQFEESLLQTDRDNVANDQAQADLVTTLASRLG